jgi:hypothetical protein
MYYDKETKIWKCNDCYVTYKTKKPALAHVCKKVQSNLECPLCHEVFGYLMKRIRHEPECPINQIPIYTVHEIIKFDMRHMSIEVIEKCFRVFNLMDGFNEAVKTLYTNAFNRNVRKKSQRDFYSEVYVGKGNWEYRPDFEVYPRLVYSLSSKLLQVIATNNGRLRGIVDFLHSLLEDESENMKKACVIFKLDILVASDGILA